MSASSLLNLSGDLSLKCAVPAPVVDAVLTASCSSVVVVFAGRASVALGTGAVAIAVPGLLATDIVLVTTQTATTPANAFVPCRGEATADTLTLQSNFATTAETVGFLVLRPNV